MKNEKNQHNFPYNALLELNRVMALKNLYIFLFEKYANNMKCNDEVSIHGYLWIADIANAMKSAPTYSILVYSVVKHILY